MHRVVPACLKHTMTAREYFRHMEKRMDPRFLVCMVRDLNESRSISWSNMEKAIPACNPTAPRANDDSRPLAADRISNAQKLGKSRGDITAWYPGLSGKQLCILSGVPVSYGQASWALIIKMYTSKEVRWPSCMVKLTIYSGQVSQHNRCAGPPEYR